MTQNHHCDYVPLNHSEQRNCMASPIMGVFGSDNFARGAGPVSEGMFDADGDSVVKNWRNTAGDHRPQTDILCCKDQSIFHMHLCFPFICFVMIQ
jgi:hypothetical protein